MTKSINTFLGRFREKLQSDDLKIKCFRGGVILSSSVGFERAMRFLRLIVLAKLIAPDQMGLVTLCALVLALFETASETGIRQSVIQNRHGDETDFLNAAWWFQSVRGLGVTLLGILLSGIIAALFGKPELTWLLRAAFLAIWFNALVSPSSFLLEKHMRFGKYVLLNQGSMLIGTVLTIVLAFWMRSAWPMIIGIAVEGIIKALLSFGMCPFVPRLPVDRKSLSELFVFARGMFGMPLLSLAALYADVLLVGRMCTISEVGYYGMAAYISRIPRDLAMQVVGKLLLPAFASRQEKDESLRKGFLLAAKWMTLGAAPLSAFLLMWSGPALMAVSRPEYTAASWALKLLAMVVFFRVHGVLFWNLYIATAQLKQNRFFLIVRVVTMGVCMVPFVSLWAMTGAAAAVLAGELAGFAVQVWMAARKYQISFREYAMSLMPGVSLGILIILAGFVERFFFALEVKSALTIGLLALSCIYLVAGICEYPVLRAFLRSQSQ